MGAVEVTPAAEVAAASMAAEVAAFMAAVAASMEEAEGFMAVR
jgi:hypothetical protein